MKLFFLLVFFLFYAFSSNSAELNCLVLTQDKYLININKDNSFEWEESKNLYELLDQDRSYENFEISLDDKLVKKLENNRPFLLNPKEEYQTWIYSNPISNDIEARIISFNKYTNIFLVKTAICNIFF